MKKKYYCSVSGEEIPKARVKFLLENGVPEERMTCLKVAEHTVKRKKGVFLDEDATDLVICDDLSEGKLFAVTEEVEEVEQPKERVYLEDLEKE